MPDQIQLPGRISSSAFERPTLSLANFLRGDVGAGFQALADPSKLSPVQRRTLADEIGVGGDDFRGKLLRTIQNPLVLIGLILAVKFPIPGTKELFRFAPKLTDLARKPGLVRRFIGGIDATFEGLLVGKNKTLPDVYKALLRDVEGFQKTFARRLGDSIARYEKASGTGFDRAKQVLLAAKLEGRDLGAKAAFNPINLGQDFELLTNETRKIFSDAFDQTFGKVDIFATKKAAQEAGLSVKDFNNLLKRRSAILQEGGDITSIDSILKPISKARNSIRREMLNQLNASGIDTTIFDRVNKVDQYFPRRIIGEFSQSSSKDIDSLADVLSGSQQDLRFAGRTVHARARRGGAIMNPDDLKLVRDFLKNPDMPERFESILAANPGLRKYSLHFNESASSYFHSLSRAFGWTVQGHGKDILKGLERLEASPTAANKVRASMLRNTYIPAALGKQTIRQIESTAQWDSMKLSLVENLKTGNLNKFLPKEVSKWLKDKLVQDQGLFSARNVQGRLAQHLTVGALGANPVSATWNMMQTLLTTVPVIGLESTTKGLVNVLKKAPKYFKLRSAGFAHDAALAKVWPDFASEGLAAAPFSDEVLKSLDRAFADTATLALSTKRPLDRARSALMAMFQGTENLVRLTAFEGTINKAVSEGISVAEAAPIARRVTEATQFLTGPANLPFIFAKSGPLLRQFGTFPLRYLDFLVGTATELGSAAQGGGILGLAPNRNFGTLGRALLTSGVAYEGSQELFGQDISQGLLFGALPSRPPGTLLSPLPFIPPAVSIAAATAKALTGDTSPLVSQLPILIPGGVELARLSTAYAPDVAKALGRNFADYKATLPDGRIPILDGDGNLRALARPMQLYMQAFGIPPGGPGGLQKEQELSKYLLSQREKIVNMRREFVNAIVQNDVRRATQINDQYKAQYPGTGEIKIGANDVKAVQLRLMVPRLERILETAPAQVRPQLAQAIQAALGSEAESLLGVDPGLLAVPGSTIRSREVFRQQPPRNIVEELAQKQFDKKLGASPRPTAAQLRRARRRSINRQTRLPQPTSPFSTGLTGRRSLDLTPF